MPMDLADTWLVFQVDEGIHTDLCSSISMKKGGNVKKPQLILYIVYAQGKMTLKALRPDPFESTNMLQIKDIRF